MPIPSFFTNQKHAWVPVFATISAAFASQATAETVRTIPQIVITATRQPEDITKIASTVTVITEEEIKQKNKPTVAELLRTVPGMNLVGSGGIGQNVRVFMRGTNSNHTLVMMDGVPLNDPSDTANAYDFSNLTTDNIERIEILRGAQSTIYGSQALGGVINIITKKGRGAPRYTAFAEYGRYESEKVGVGASGETRGTSYSLTASGSHTDGISSFDKRLGGTEKDGNYSYSFSGNVESKLNENFTAKLNARYNRSVTEFDSVGSIASFGARPDDDVPPIADNRQINMRAAGQLSLAEGRWVQELGVSTLNFNRSLITEYFDAMFNPIFGRQQYQGHRDTIDWIHKLAFFSGQVITVGTEFSTEYYRTNELAQVDVGNRAFFINDQLTYGEGFFANIGARLDEHQQFGRQATFKIAPGYHFASTGTRIKASYGTGFKAPSLAQLYTPNSGSPLLGPEKSKGLDAGFEQSLWQDKVTFGATVFRNFITDLVGFGPAPTFATVNIGKARTQGVESSFSFQPDADWTLNANYTFTTAENTRDHTRLLRRPKHLANVSANYRYNLLGDVGVSVRYVGSSRDFYYASAVGAKTDLRPFATIDLSTNYAVHPNATLYARLDNLLDKRYQEISGYGQPGRGLYVGVKAAY